MKSGDGGRDDETPSDEPSPLRRIGTESQSVQGAAQSSTSTLGADTTSQRPLPQRHSSSDDTFYSFPPTSPSQASSVSGTSAFGSPTIPPPVAADPWFLPHYHHHHRGEPLFNSDENITVVIRGDHFSPSSISPDSTRQSSPADNPRPVEEVGAVVANPAVGSPEARQTQPVSTLPILAMPRPSYPHPSMERWSHIDLPVPVLGGQATSTAASTPPRSSHSSVYVIPGEAITSDDISPTSRYPVQPRPFSPDQPQHVFPHLTSPTSQHSGGLNSDETLFHPQDGEGDGSGEVDSAEDYVPEMKETYGEAGAAKKVNPLRRKSPIGRASLDASKERSAVPGAPPTHPLLPPPPSPPPPQSFSSDPYFAPDIIYDSSEELAVIRVLDTRLLPWILISIFVLSMDRTNHSNAISDNLPQDLGFDIDTVNVGAAVHSTLFFVFCLVGAVAAKIVGPARFIPILMFTWGMITVAHAFIRNRRDYLAGVIPSILVYFGRFYKGNEFATRLAYLWSAQMIGSAVSGLSASGLLHLRGIFKMEGWRWLFLTDGVITIVLAIFTWFYLPRHAAHTTGGIRGKKPWFTDRQVQVSVTRVVRDDIAKRRLDKPVTWADARDTFSDPKIWIHVLNTTIGLTPMTPLHTYFPLTIKNFHFNVFAANALTAPPHFLQAISTILLIRHSDRVRERGFHGAIGTGWQLVGWFLLLFLPSGTPRIVKYFAAVIVASYPAVHPLNVAWMAENAGSIGKRVIATGAMSGFSAIHGTWGSQIYRADDAPDFRRGNSINVAFATTALCMWLVQKYYYQYLNRRHANQYAELTPEEREREELLEEANGNSSVLFRFTFFDAFTTMFPDQTAGQRVAMIPEILGQVFECSARGDQVRSARVNRFWCDVALSLVWERLVDLRVLFRLLAPLNTNDGMIAFARVLTSKDWARFDYYARRVREVVQSPRRPALHPSLVTEIMSTRGPAELLPNLSRMHFDGQRPLRHLHLFLHPNVTRLAISRQSGNALLGAILFSLPTKTPSITHISLSEDMVVLDEGDDSHARTMFAEALPVLSSLRSLTLPLHWFTPAVVDAAAFCVSLDELSTAPLKGERDDIELFEYDQLYSLSLRHDGFPGLRSLSIILPFHRAAMFISQDHRFHVLTHFEAQSPYDIVRPHEYDAILSALSESCSGLESIVLSTAEPREEETEHEAITYHELSSITQLIALQSVDIHHTMPLQLFAEDVIAMARALPNLTTLSLNPAPAVDAASTLVVSILSSLRDLCQNLTSLGLYLNAEDEHIPPPPSIDEELRQAVPEKVEFASLKKLTVRLSSLSSPAQLAVYLSYILPLGCVLNSSSCVDHAAWGEAQKLIPVFKQVRAQGMRTGLLRCDALSQ
ncbi:hypothetical protein EYR40_008148 [Pleurotus pulmonarius]|nr:hypothetical protein EYR38_007545 [Pleurotus pulmonarius]KAF4597684.1 hypothetical protein EYR40_008148 [Pleurotus pulmonarius]